MNIAYTEENKTLVAHLAPGVTPEQAASAMGLADGTWRVISDAEAETLQKALEIIPTASEQREQAYQQEADPLHKKAQQYQDEAEGFRLLDDLASAAIAEEKARQYLKDYASKKAEIRLRIPDQPFYLLNSTGTYHAEGCTYTSESAEHLTLDQLAARDNVKPCARCNAPALPEGNE